MTEQMLAVERRRSKSISIKETAGDRNELLHKSASGQAKSAHLG